MESIIGSPAPVVPPGVTPNTTVPSIPYLSAAATYADSPLFRFDANTIEQRNGANSQVFRLYSSYTDANNNAGVRFTALGLGGNVLETFKNGNGNAGDLQVNSNGIRTKLAVAGNDVLICTATGVSPQQPITTFAISGVGGPAGATAGAGAPWIVVFDALDNHTDATRTDPIFVVGANSTGALQGGSYRVNLQYQCHTAQVGASLTFSFSWIDNNNNTHTRTGTLDLSNVANETSLIFVIRVKGNQTLSVISTIAGGGSAAYDARFFIEQLT